MRPTLPSIINQAIADCLGPPAAVVVDRKGALLHIHGQVEDFLQLAPGDHTGLLADVAREGLRDQLASAVLAAATEDKKVVAQARANKDRGSVPVKMTVTPLRQPREANGLLLVTFEPQKVRKSSSAVGDGEGASSDLRQVEDELRLTREELSSTISQLEHSNEHLRASNEEVMSANEELQSANEELEASKDELNSLNEQLNAVNQRLQEKVTELEQTGNDVANLLASGKVATIFLDRRLCIRRFTPAVTKLLSLIDGDVGRPITDVARKFQDEALLEDVRRVLATLAPATAEVQADDGSWYSRTILPYRTREDRIEGVVITFADVTGLKRLSDALRVSEEQARWLGRFPAENPYPVLRVSADGVVLYQNPAAEARCDWRCKVNKPLPQETLRRLVGKAMADGKPIEQDIELGGVPYSVAVAPVLAECYANVYGRDITWRRAAEEAVRESERRFVGVLESMPDAFVSFDRDLRYTYVNGNAERMQSVRREELIGKDVRDVYPDAESRKSISRYEQVLREQEPVTFVSHHAGFDRWMEISAFPTPDGVSVFYKDVSEQVKAVEALSASEKRLGLALIATELGTWDYDPQTGVLKWDARCKELFGLLPDAEVNYETFLAGLHTDDRERANRIVQHTFDPASGGLFDIEYRTVGLQDGGVMRWIHATGRAYFNEAGKASRFIGTVQDITERKAAETRLQTTLQRFYATLSSMYGSILLVADSGRVEFANRSFCELFKLKLAPDELVGKTAPQILEMIKGAYADPQKTVERIAQIVAAGEPVKGEEVAFADGTTCLRDYIPIILGAKAHGRLWHHIDITSLKRAEEALQRLNAELENRVAERTAELERATAKVLAERQRFLDVLETLPVILAIIRTNHRIEWANRAYRDALGENVGKLCYAAQFGCEQPCQECQAFVPLKTGKPHNWEWTLPNGRTFDIFNFPFVDADGSEMILEMDIDITEQRQADATIKAERQRLFDVLETLPVYVILLSEDYRVPFANRFFEERFGASQGKRCYEYLFGRNEPCENCETYKVMKTRQPHHWHWTGPDERNYDIYDFPFTDSDGSNLILEMGIDITEQRQAEAELKKASLYVRSLIEAAVDPLVTIGPDGRITDVNVATEQATGLGRVELIGTDFSTYFTEPDKAREGYQQAFREGTVRDYPLAIRHKDGRVTPVLYNATIYRDAEGTVSGVFAAARDVTELTKVEQALREANETLEARVAERTAELARSNEDLQQFAYVASHDLQEPLRMVNGFLKLLENRHKQQLAPKAQEYIGFAVDGATRMSSLIRDLLEYSRVGRQTRQIERTDAGAALAGAMANLREAIAESGATVAYAKLPSVLGDPTQLMQLFQNLLGNAIKFRSPDRPCHIDVGATEKDGHWQFWVKDNGIGIDQEQHDRVFVIFQRLHTREEYPGTGIGLAVCKKIVERHGGRMWIESKVGEGSTFYFTFQQDGQA